MKFILVPCLLPLKYLDRRAVKKINKDRFLLISSILSIIDKNINLLIVIDFYRFF